MRLLFILLSVIFVCDYVDSSKKKQKSVTTVIDAKWEVTPLALEMAEYLYDENPPYFWKFLDLLSNLTPPLVEEGKYSNH